MSAEADLRGEIEASIREAIGTDFTLDDAGALTGGSCNTVIAGSGRHLFAKLMPAVDRNRIDAEIDGLEALARCDAFRIPRVIARGANDQQAWLILERLELHPVSESTVAARAAEALAAMHAHEGERYGWHRDNYIGRTPQCNLQCDSWARFFAQQRLAPQFALATANGHGRDLQRQGERILERVPAMFLEHRPRPSLLHGDLWHGNIAALADGSPTVYDPACYFGDREADLAMSELFGGLPTAFFVAYRRAAPLTAEYESRKLLYNLYHMLNHLNLFGGSYLSQVNRMVVQLSRLLGC